MNIKKNMNFLNLFNEGHQNLKIYIHILHP